MKLVVLSNPINLTDEHLIMQYLFELGLTHFHVRKPGFSESDLRLYLEEIPLKYMDRVVLHAHHELAPEYGCLGIHFNQAAPETYEKYQWNVHKSISTHYLDELEDLEQQIGYAFLSPVFNSISKQGYVSQFDSDKLSSFLEALDKPAEIIALGGIEVDKVQRCMEMGFDGVAVLGTIWETYKSSGVRQTIAEFKRLKAECDKWANIV